MPEVAEYVDNLPNITGREKEAVAAMNRGAKQTQWTDRADIDFGNIKATFANALHMHQPIIPAGGGDLHTAELISNLQYMMEHQDIGDNHNAPVFVWCYKRLGEIIPNLLNEGANPRIMLEYSGNLFHGMRKMGLDDVFDNLKRITCDPATVHTTEWLGCPWGHAVAPSTPMQDYKLHVLAWQQHFAAIFGDEALERVRGFSPSEMALPNHPDVAYEYVKTLVDCGFQWVLIQEHSIEKPEDGHHSDRPHVPHRLVCRNSDGDEVSIIAIVKTQGSDTKLVAQMQPYYEAQSLSRWELGGKSIPPLVTQVADGENGGVMMNEFPPKFEEAMRLSSGSDVPAMNGSEYLEHLFAMGIKVSDFPVVQPVKQKRLWDHLDGKTPGREAVDKAIEELKQQDHQFHMDGGSWTDDISWVKGYDNVLGPMERVSSLFNEKVLSKKKVDTSSAAFRNTLFHLMCSQTSCYRYWGQGQWTDYGIEICRRAEEIIKNDF